VSYLSTNDVIGDYPIEIGYTDYGDFGGIKFPRHFVQTEDGHPTFEITISEVKPNAAVTWDAPTNVQQPGPGLAFWGDGYNPPHGDDPCDPARASEQGIDLYRIITMNNLDVKTIAPAHGAAPKPFDNLKRAIGLLPP
jgi:hypothetical protein